MTDVSELTEMLDSIGAKIDALQAENKRLREALKEAEAWLIDGMSSYKWLEAYKVISAAITQDSKPCD